MQITRKNGNKNHSTCNNSILKIALKKANLIKKKKNMENLGN